tara:strand:- start:524 stop:1108 length:585 start_codon:yes stop_codon:yes gene_type:complete
MSRTKVKQNLIDASFGNILEQIVYYADGKTVTTSAGNFTAPNITAITAVGSSSFVENTGCAVSYTPPAGTTKVYYEAAIQLRYYNVSTNTHMSPSYYVALDNTLITQTKRTQLQQYTYEMNVSPQAVINIDGTDSIATGQVTSWTSARTFKVFMSGYGNSNYRYYMNGVYHYAGNGGSGVEFVSPPVIKITAYS